MADDHIRIDPEFLPPPRERPGKRTAALALAAVAVVVLAFGWLLSSPDPNGSIADTATDSFAALETVETTTTTAPTLVSLASPLAETSVPLAQLVPGFTDTVVLLTTPPGRFDVVRWEASASATEVSLSVERDAAGAGSWPIGLDASGSWFARILSDGILVAYPVPDSSDERPEPQPVGLRVRSATWNETEPGQLAWLACSRSSPGPAVLTTLDLDDRSAEPITLHPFERGCVTGRRGGVWLGRWTIEGVTVNSFGQRPSTPVSFIVGASTLTERPFERYPRSVPGVTDSTLIVNASWSSNASLVAANITPDPTTPNSVVRIVDMETGEVVFEAEGQNSGAIPMAWSTDDRFLLYTRIHSTSEHQGSGFLVVYDTLTDRATTVRLGEFVDEIRTDQGPDPA